MFDELLAANTSYADEFLLEGIAPVAARGFALVTCMDSRIEPLTMLGLHPGDAKILRNAGARVTPDVLRSLVLATRLYPDDVTQYQAQADALEVLNGVMHPAFMPASGVWLEAS